MPRLLSQSKHEEFESNSTLQIRIRRKEEAKEEKEEKQRISHHGAKISHWCEIAFPVPVHPAFDILTFLYYFLVFFPFCPPGLMYFEGILVFYPICISI